MHYWLYKHCLLFLGGLSKTSYVNWDTDAGSQAVFKVLVHPEVLHFLQQRQTEVEHLQRRQLSSTKGLYVPQGLQQTRQHHWMMQCSDSFLLRDSGKNYDLQRLNNTA